MIKLLPQQDIIDFALHVPKTPTWVYFLAADKYDPDCLRAAMQKLREPPLENVDINTLLEKMVF